MNIFSSISTWIAGLRIATRQIIAFMLILVLMLVVGFAGIAGLARLNSKVNEIVVFNNAKLALAQSQRQALGNQQRDVLSLFLANSSKEREDLLNSIKYQSGLYDDAKVGIKELFDLSKPTEREIANNTKILSDEVMAKPILSKVMEMVEKDDLEQAIQLMQTDVKNRLDTWISDIDELVSTEQRLNDKIASSAQKEYIMLRNFTLICIVLAVCLSIGIGFVFTRILLQVLGGEPTDAAHVVNEVSKGNLTVAIGLRPDDTGSFMAALARTVSQLSSTLFAVHQNSNQISINASKLAEENSNLSKRTEKQASALEETAASMEELRSTVEQNTHNVCEANQLSMKASNVAVLGGDIVGQVMETMKCINESSRKISEIISVIDGIAFQTNILALNAAVEAARAGEQGRGFAVVASEVRSLAGRSADAAREIKDLINTSVERVEQGVLLAGQAGTTMADVVSAIRQVTNIVSFIKVASDEQALGLAQICDAVLNIDQATQQNGLLVGQIATASSNLNNDAKNLVQAVSVFKFDTILAKG